MEKNFLSPIFLSDSKVATASPPSELVGGDADPTIYTPLRYLSCLLFNFLCLFACHDEGFAKSGVSCGY